MHICLLVADLSIGGPLLIFLIVVAFVLLATSIRIAQEYQRGVVFRLGRYVGTRGPGLYLLIPFGIETQSLIDIRIKTVPIESQETITRDSVTIRVNAALWYKVVDPAKSVIAVTDVFAAIYQLALTTLRNTIGQHDLDEVLPGAATKSTISCARASSRRRRAGALRSSGWR